MTPLTDKAVRVRIGVRCEWEERANIYPAKKQNGKGTPFTFTLSNRLVEGSDHV
jgi:hypothetical protein